MRVVRSTTPGVAVVDVDEPDGAGELISIRSASICASDFGYIEMGSQFLLGHELAGTTEDGRAVAIEAIFGCGECDLCLEGRYNLCATTGTTALGLMADGGMSEWFRAPARSLVDLPEGLAATDACLVEPTAVAWHSCRLAGAGPDQRVCVVGGGRHRADGGGIGARDGRRRGVPGGPLSAPDRAGRAARGHGSRRGCTTSSSRPPAPRARCTAAPSWPRPEARWVCSACSVPKPPGRRCSAS